MQIQYLAFVRLPTEKAHGLQIMKTCEALGASGAEVELVVPGRTTTLAGDPFSYYEVKKNFTLAALQTPDWVGLGFFGFLASAIWFAEAAKFRTSFWKADVVYSRDAVVLLQYVLLGRKLVYEAHRAPTAVDRFVAHRAYRVVVISEALRTEFIAIGIPKEKIILAEDAVDVEFFKAARTREIVRSELGIPDHTPVAAYVGSLAAGKGAPLIADAAALMPETVFVVAGVSDESSVRFWGAAPVRLMGHIVRTKVRDLLHAADVLILPNSSHDQNAARYGSPMKLFEYMASGTPIVAADVPSIRAVLPPGAAFYVASDNVQALAAGVAEALSSPDAKDRVFRALELVGGRSWTARAARILQGL